MKTKVLIAVAWPYVNGELHIGHLAGYLLPADIYSRYRHAIGDDVIMVSGSDSHGTPITVEAEKKNLTPAQVVELYHPQVHDLFLNKLHLTYDIYTTTMTQNHAEVVQECFLNLLKNGYIIKKSARQYYSPEESRFLPDRYVEGTCSFCCFNDARGDQCDNCGKLLDVDTLSNPRSKFNNTAIEIRETEHYYIDWPKMQPLLQKYITKTSPQWRKWVAQETQGWLDEGLQPRAITRDIDWGVAIPHDKIPAEMQLKDAPTKRFYVWFEAVQGYLSATKELCTQRKTDWKNYWYGEGIEHHYFMGKDNLVFHTLFWPGQLMGNDPELHLPDQVVVNMFLNLEGKQFSKSRGVIILIKELIEQYGNDSVRFYFTNVMPETSDASFSWSNFEEVHNNVLVGTYGNYVSRTLSLGAEADFAQVAAQSISPEGRSAIIKAFESGRASLHIHKYKEFLKAVLDLSSHANKFISDKKVWELRDKTKAGNQQSDAYYQAIHEMYAYLIAMAYLFAPVMPESSEKICVHLGLKNTGWPTEGKEYEEIAALLPHVAPNGDLGHLFTKMQISA